MSTDFYFSSGGWPLGKKVRSRTRKTQGVG
jgi:hypothetical protein